MEDEEKWEKLYNDPGDPDHVQYHKLRQQAMLPSVINYAASFQPVSLSTVLDVLVLLMEEMPDVSGMPEAERKEALKQALVRAHERWTKGDRL